MDSGEGLEFDVEDGERAPGRGTVDGNMRR